MASNGRKRSFGEVLRSRIDSALAIEVIHAAMQGQDVTRTQLDAARIALGKCLPDLKAVALQISESAQVTKADIDSLLLAHGLQPETEFSRIIDGHTVDQLPTIADDANTLKNKENHTITHNNASE
jgi:hypothetical protein